MDTRHDVTRLLLELSEGRQNAFDDLVPLVYEDLRRIARAHLAHQGAGATLNTTALVHEAFLKLVDRTQVSWENRGHFLAVYSVVMRNLLIDLARQRNTKKRGGDRQRISLDVAELKIDDQAEQLLALDEAMQRLAQLDMRLAKVVECRFFAGLTEQETAQALQVTDRTVRRDWVKARALLYQMLEEPAA